MKFKTLVTIAATVAISAPCLGWGRLGHATINKIAEDHLTSKTLAKISEYMGGESIVTFASYPDDYRDRLNASYHPEWNKAKGGYAHTFEVDEKLQAYHGCEADGRKLTNSLYFMDGFIRDCMNIEELSDSAKFISIVMLCHFVGDMHCPTHIRYQPTRDIGKIPVSFAGEPSNYHKIWDGDIIKMYYPWSFSDFAKICDIWSKSQIAETIQGNIYDWAHDSAVTSRDVRDVISKGQELDNEWSIDQLELARLQIRKAGYRLAHQLNMLFDPKYAKKHNK